jgi:pimeloyl-ACP methyl ester carboxylesterase
MGKFHLPQAARAVLFILTALVLWIFLNFSWSGFEYGLLLGILSLLIWTFFVVEGALFIQHFLSLKLKYWVYALRAFTIDLYAKALAFSTVPFPQTLKDPITDEGEVPILLIHGYLVNSGIWFYHRYHYRYAGLKNVFTVDLRNPFGTIEEHAETVSHRILAIQKLTNCRKIRLVGHSMGGLVAAYYAMTIAERDSEDVLDLITMGSPLYGTPMALIGIGGSSKEMLPESPLIKGLSLKLERSQVRSFHLGSVVDTLVFPFDSTFIHAKGNHLVIKYEDLGHASFLFSDRVIQEIIDYLRKSTSLDKTTETTERVSNI